ncbi:hypothetical protein [Methanoregula sp. PtaU1.Bin006]|jgi:hypothetical protein|uniref:hypothetical protein n=1 Tax=Methanoregula sp. PtaU1.Bin006 TaxID=1811681 RepID=UPI0025F9DA29|nr:hypothetical protein [Methanoregula sp. PtaU1.Bin006]
MDPYDFSAMRRELVYQEFMIHNLQEEEKKRWEELHALERDLEKLREDPKYQQLLKLVENSRVSRSRSRCEHGDVVRSVRRGRR